MLFDVFFNTAIYLQMHKAYIVITIGKFQIGL